MLAVVTGAAVRKLSIPDSRVVLIDCDDDPPIPAAVRDDVVAHDQGAELFRLPVGGQYPYITQSETYTKLIERRLLG